MRLYHGSNTRIDRIDLALCRPFKDFGRGFYLTPVLDHAQTLARNRAVRFGGNAIVTEFEFDYNSAKNDSSLKIKEFDKPDREWVEFVMKNRDEGNVPPIHDFDIVIGPIADDRVAASITLYQNEFISIEDLIERLKYRELSIQYFFHTPQALKHLKRL